MPNSFWCAAFGFSCCNVLWLETFSLLRFGYTPGLEILSQVNKESTIPWTFPVLLALRLSVFIASAVCLHQDAFNHPVFCRYSSFYIRMYFRPSFLPCNRGCKKRMKSFCSADNWNWKWTLPHAAVSLNPRFTPWKLGTREYDMPFNNRLPHFPFSLC